jgi:putative transposase
VALAALKGDRTVNEPAGQYGAHPTLIHGWEKQRLAGADQVFSNPSKAAADAEAEKAELFDRVSPRSTGRSPRTRPLGPA